LTNGAHRERNAASACATSSSATVLGKWAKPHRAGNLEHLSPRRACQRIATPEGTNPVVRREFRGGEKKSPPEKRIRRERKLSPIGKVSVAGRRQTGGS
jgi:hypothetical protein